MQNHTANELIAAFDADRAMARADRNRRTRSAHQSALVGAAMGRGVKIGVCAALVSVVALAMTGIVVIL